MKQATTLPELNQPPNTMLIAVSKPKVFALKPASLLQNANIARPGEPGVYLSSHKRDVIGMARVFKTWNVLHVVQPSLCLTLGVWSLEINPPLARYV